MNRDAKTADIFAAFRQLNIVVIGDVMIDRYLRGRVDRISPEAPVPVVQMIEAEDRPGGAANVALNLAALGATPYLVSVVGDDEQGRTLTELLPTHGLTDIGLVVSAQRPTTLKTRVLAGSQQLLRVDREVQHDLQREEEAQLLQCLETICTQQRIDVVILQDYNKGVLSESVIGRVLAFARKHQIPTAVDPKHNNFWAYRGATLFKPNLREMQQQTDWPLTPDATVLDRAARLTQEKLANRFTLITLSEHGLYLHADSASAIYPTRRRNIADVCGAGDTVISVAAAALALELPLAQIALLANLAGGQVCERIGVVPVDVEQLAKEFAEEIK